jgi:predicted RNA binding protein YcfA (HicA-like mRNA interferase family)
VKYRELRRLARQAGFRPVRQRGSHQIWKNPGRPDVEVAIAGHDRKDVKAGLLAKTLRKLGLR